MLDILRNNTRSFIVYLMFAVIIIVFVFTFNTITPDQACGGAGPVGLVADLGEVGDTVIDTNMLDVAMNLSVDPASPKAKGPQSLQRNFSYRNSRFLRLGLGGAYSDFGRDPSLVSPLKIEKVMDDLVETLLVAHLARETGFSVSDNELADRLITDDWYDEQGTFRRKDYDNFVRFQVGTSPSRFEDFVRKELLREKMITALVGGVGASDAELAFHHAAENEKVDLSIIAIDDAVAAAFVPVADGDLDAWIGAHGDEIKAYYEGHGDEFNKPERVVVRGIQIKATNRALIELEKDEAKKATMEKGRADARTRAEGVLASLAATPAEDAPADDAKAAAQADPTPAAAPKAATVSVEAFTAAVTKDSDHSATKETGGLFDKARSAKEMARWPFGEEAATAVFALEAGQVTGLVEVASGYWILRVDEKLAPETKTLEDARRAIAGKLLRKEKAGPFRIALAKEVLLEAKKDPTKSLADVAGVINERHGGDAKAPALGVRQTGPFSRLQAGAFGAGAAVGNIPGVGSVPDLARAAFQATAEAPVLGEVFDVDNGAQVIVARLAGREASGERDQESSRALEDRLVRAKQRLFYRGWYRGALQDAVGDGTIVFSEEWRGLLEASIAVYRDAGGVLAPAQMMPVGDPTGQ